MAMHTGPFGSCCEDLADSMGLDDPSFFVEDNGVLYLTVGTAEGPDGGRGYLDHAVVFCPFCGVQLQISDDIARRAQDWN
jgi:hypothetical protein